MYKVLIVEDEILISAGLRSMIRWEEYNMLVIGEAHNGKEGLELYHREKPDVILADIRMPIMDGLEMLSEIREKDKITRVVVLSCHNEFDLVRKAFHLGITDYIQKMTMLPEDIHKILAKVQQELFEIRKSTNTEEGKPDDSSNNIVLRGREYIMYQSCSCQEFRSFAGDLQISEEGIVVVVMEVLEPERLQKKDKAKKEYKRQVIRSLIREALIRKQAGNIFRESENRFILVLNFPDAESVEQKIVQLEKRLDEICFVLQKYVNSKACFGISHFDDSFKELGTMYSEALDAERDAVFLGEKVVFYNADNVSQKYRDAFLKIEERIKTIEWLSNASKGRIIREISIQVQDGMISAQFMKETFERWVHRISFESMIQTSELLKEALEVSKKLCFASTLTECMELFEGYLNYMSSTTKGMLMNPSVIKAIQYIKQHYYEEGISLAYVADVIGLNKDYLGSLLRKETGYGFSDYINSIRISKACDLLVNSNMKSHAISREVGFKDEGHFSRTFKKIMGMNASEYRRCERLTEVNVDD